MKIATAFSTQSNLATALQEASTELLEKLGRSPDLTLVYYTENFDPHLLSEALTAQSTTQIHGCSTCIALMSSTGFHSDDGKVLGLWAASDPDGAYGSALIEMNNQPRRAGAEAIKQALNNAHRTGEMPDLVWLSATPGSEEEVILGIQDVIGKHIPITGGSAADNNVAGNWSIIANHDVTNDGIAVTVMFPSVEISYAFQSGYTATTTSGKATKVARRIVYEIDGRPAAEAYNEWTGCINHAMEGGGNILTQTALHPLGRKVASVGPVELFKLSHPSSVTTENALTLFSDVAQGERLVLMTGSKNSLLSRAGRVAKSALDVEEMEASNISGALIIYCAGCMLAVKDEMDEVVDSINANLKNKPFLGAFTFGEQGCLVEGGNIHGNLMISAVIFNGK